MTVKVQITHEGETRDVNVDMRLDSMTLQEMVRLEEALGSDLTDRLLSGRLPVNRPSVIQAILYAKIATDYPDTTLDGFDLDFGELDFSEITDSEPEDVPIPMQVEGEEETEASVPFVAEA